MARSHVSMVNQNARQKSLPLQRRKTRRTTSTPSSPSMPVDEVAPLLRPALSGGKMGSFQQLSTASLARSHHNFCWWGKPSVVKRGFASLQARSTMLSMSAAIASSSHKLLVTTDGRPVANTTLLVRSSDDVSSQQSYYIFWSTCAC